MKKNKNFCFCSVLTLFALFALANASCTFDYGEGDSSGDDLPDLIMENVDYVRVRSADPLARIQADRVERYEKQSLMKIDNLVFEQYGERGEEVNVYGKSGHATVEIESGDIFLSRNVRIEAQTEDIVFETYQLEWRDGERTVASGENDEVFVYRDNGTRFTGVGLRANTRMRTWEFLRNISGTYIHDGEVEE